MFIVNIYKLSKAYHAKKRGLIHNNRGLCTKEHRLYAAYYLSSHMDVSYTLVTDHLT